MRKCICWLLLLFSLTSFAGASETEKPLLPDPGLYRRALGELIAEDAEMNGTTYDVYGYSFYKTANNILSTLLMAYEWGVTGKGFTYEQLSVAENPQTRAYTYWYAIAKDGITAYLTYTGKPMGSACTMTLYVPDGFAFELATELPNATPFYNDLYLDTNDLTAYSGSSDTPVICSYCYGSKRCPECHGTGKYRNPYTGDYSSCSCGDGECPICDGEGVW